MSTHISWDILHGHGCYQYSLVTRVGFVHFNSGIYHYLPVCHQWCYGIANLKAFVDEYADVFSVVIHSSGLFSSLLNNFCAINRPWPDCNGCNLMRKYLLQKVAVCTTQIYPCYYECYYHSTPSAPVSYQLSSILRDSCQPVNIIHGCYRGHLIVARGWNHTARPHYNHSQYNTV